MVLQKKFHLEPVAVGSIYLESLRGQQSVVLKNLLKFYLEYFFSESIRYAPEISVLGGSFTLIVMSTFLMANVFKFGNINMLFN